MSGFSDTWNLKVVWTAPPQNHWEWPSVYPGYTLGTPAQTLSRNRKRKHLLKSEILVWLSERRFPSSALWVPEGCPDGRSVPAGLCQEGPGPRLEDAVLRALSLMSLQLNGEELVNPNFCSISQAFQLVLITVNQVLSLSPRDKSELPILQYKCLVGFSLANKKCNGPVNRKSWQEVGKLAWWA